ncbi:hypothetical protein OUZ56_003412 [Daphnia magna]|uniref:Uncharacterized protein n=1 Tax=Daphnia magna TaxID=35525 RepID=A0ABR0A8L6_9CRUS|nr:hypothetical protein OUZ56_003412 [Daphnia magna]
MDMNYPTFFLSDLFHLSSASDRPLSVGFYSTWSSTVRIPVNPPARVASSVAYLFYAICGSWSPSGRIQRNIL